MPTGLAIKIIQWNGATMANVWQKDLNTWKVKDMRRFMIKEESIQIGCVPRLTNHACFTGRGGGDPQMKFEQVSSDGYQM